MQRVWLHKPLGVALAVAAFALGLRLVGLGTFMTVDEENWMLRSAGFYHTLFRKGDTGGTFMTTHPGAAAMWVIGAGIVGQERRVGFDIDTSNLRHFRLAATLPPAVATAVLVGLVAYLTSQLLGVSAAFWGGLLLAAEPYLVGMSQIAHLDALLALFMLGSVLSFLLSYYSLRVTRYWLLGGVLAGLALGTKLLPALWLFAFFSFVTLFFKGWQRARMRLRLVVSGVGFVFGAATLTLWTVWPVLWFTDDVMRSFNRDVPRVLTQEHVALEILEEPIEPMTFYVRTVLGRSTPFVQILVVACLLMGLTVSLKYSRILPALWLLLYVVGFIVLLTFSAKKADRYALPALVVLPLIAGWIWSRVLPLLKYWGAAFGLGRLHVWIGVVVGSSILSLPLFWAPYTLAYNNPIFDIRPLSQQGWGEGLDAAARWLNSHPFIDRLVVASWYPGVMRTYFYGTTMSLSSRDDHRVGFVVTYRNMEGRGGDTIASDVLDEFRSRVPAHVVSIQGVPYAWIYNVVGPWYFQQHVGELVADVEAGQLVPVEKDGWRRVDIALATFSGRLNTKDVYLHIREDIDAARDIRTIEVHAREVQDEAWHTFVFDPIPDSKGKTYYVALTSPASLPGDAVTVRFTKENVLPGQMVLRRGPLKPGERNSDFLRAGDLAYRLAD